MSTAEVDRIFQTLRDAATPEEVFGTSPQETALKASYRRLARALHPDRNGGSPAAQEAFLLLQKMYEAALRLIANGTYGKPRATEVTVRAKTGRSYLVKEKISGGDIADVFACDDSKVFKIARHPRDNDLIRNEAATLRHLTENVGDDFEMYFPKVVDQIGLRQDGGVVRQSLVLERLEGFYSLEDVVRRKGRIDYLDMAWMWRRVLTALSAAHGNGVIHGAALPPHVMIQPEQHGVVLIDWAYSVRSGPIRAISRRYRNWYPPEVEAKQTATGATDIYLAARSMVYLVGGADNLPKALRAYFRACLLAQQATRLDDPGWALETFDEILERLHGRRKFRPFSMN